MIFKKDSTSPVLSDDGYCYVCGDKNPKGLKLLWRIEGKETFSEFIPQREHQGWKNILHGGLLATVLDEAMTRLIWKLHGSAVTAEMTVRYLAPVPIGKKLKIHGKIVEEKRRLVFARAEVLKEDGIIVAKAEGKSLLISSKG